ncbi:ShTK domain-containing protein [Loa loa]|uniref:ShTK domain-containing protein n=1 Tax=Loa loa TaxID=7209 RepID=A0A1I7VRL9_LOALO|nr:ShTK domain-containing protein [Loa loa]EFO17672.1 ShTK domain-containing protein [Loa loa]
MALALPLIISLLMVQTTNSQADQCDCDNDYNSPFCDGIENKEKECFVDGNKEKLSAKGTHCAKSCETCCKLPRFQCNDRGVRLDCDKIKTSGLCKTKNGVLLSLFSAECPKTCGLCGQECIDSNTVICRILKSNCENEESKRLCPKTCNVCRPINICFDMTEKCSSLKNNCNDPKLKPLMQLSCNETCGFCHTESSTVKPNWIDHQCVDADSRCAIWAANGFCTNSFYKSLVKNCPKSCRLC